jgi:hypothetical protein
MKADLIFAGLSDAAFQTEWWTGAEFEAVVACLRNFEFDSARPRDFHARTGILGKSIEDCAVFAGALLRLLESHERGALLVPDSYHRLRRAPEAFARSGAAAWTQLKSRDCAEICQRIRLLRALRERAAAVEFASPSGQLGAWETKRFLEALLQFGLDVHRALLLDERMPFAQFLSQGNLAFVRGESRRRALTESTIPDFAFAMEDLEEFVVKKEELGVVIRANVRPLSVLSWSGAWNSRRGAGVD